MKIKRLKNQKTQQYEKLQLKFKKKIQIIFHKILIDFTKSEENIKPIPINYLKNQLQSLDLEKQLI